MLDIKVDGENIKVTATGSTVDIMTELCFVIANIHATMHQQNQLMAELFRGEMSRVVGNPNSMMWDVGAVPSSGTRYVITMPIKREEDGNA